MKKIEALLQPQKLDGVREALAKAGAHGVTVTEVKGHGRQRGHADFYRSGEYAAGLLTKVKLEVVVPDELAGAVVDTIAAAARTGRVGDGKIFVLPVEEAVRIRTGERGNDAL